MQPLPLAAQAGPLHLQGSSHACLPARLSAGLSAGLPACLPACLPANLPACACLLVAALCVQSSLSVVEAAKETRVGGGGCSSSSGAAVVSVVRHGIGAALGGGGGSSSGGGGCGSCNNSGDGVVFSWCAMQVAMWLPWGVGQGRTLAPLSFSQAGAQQEHRSSIEPSVFQWDTSPRPRCGKQDTVHHNCVPQHRVQPCRRLSPVQLTRIPGANACTLALCRGLH